MQRTLVFLLVCAAFSLQGSEWTRGLPTNDTYFPIAVWLQSPHNAAKYKAAGINLYVGLWRGPTAEQLSDLAKAGMPVICSQNRYALSNMENATIVAWMHGDEPDNAQSLGRGQGYGPPIKAEVIEQNYQRIRATDPTRPVLLNLGQGVAYDNYIGRGVRRNHPEDYPEYIKGCDIASFDIYPVVHENAAVAGKLEFVAQGVERLVRWTGGEKRVWNCIECTHISNPARKATPEQVRSEVWMALISGSRGLIYFVHEFKPSQNEAALLADSDMLSAVTGINRQIHDLAPVLNSRTLTNVADVVSSAPETPIASMAKLHGGNLYLFTVNLRGRSTHGTATLKSAKPEAPVEVMGEGRTVRWEGQSFADDFKPYEVHLYRAGLARQPFRPVAQ